LPAESQRQRITVYTGPARCGKTEKIISLCAAAAESGRRALLLVPGPLDVREAGKRLVKRAGALEGSPVLTFVALAERVLTASSVTARPISLHRREMLLREIVANLAAGNRLRHFEDVIDTDGFYTGLLAFIRELKAWQIEPERFARSRRSAGARDAEIALIYGEYQKRLTGSSLYDAEGRYWRARIILEGNCPLTPPDLLLLDGFTDFTPNEISLLAVFARYCGEVAMTLPHDEERGDALFRRTGETLTRLKADFALQVEPLESPASECPMRRIAVSLFGDEKPPQIPAGDAVTLISTAGAASEMIEVAREAKRLIREGMHPTDIAVIVRRGAAYRDIAVDAFGRLGVPLDVRTGRETPGRSGLFSLIDAIADVLDGNFASRDVAKVLGSPYSDAAALAGSPFDPRLVMRAAREALIVRDLENWRKRLPALARTREAASQGPVPVGEGDDGSATSSKMPAEELRLVSAVVERLAAVLSPLSSAAEPPVAARALGEALEALGVRRRVLEADLPEEVLIADLSTFAAIDEALADLSASPENGVRQDIRSFVELVKRVALSAGAGNGGIAGGAVRFLDVASARNLSFPVVFLCGLTADVFPSRMPVGPFYSRAEREDLSHLGLASRDEKMHLATERLLFYQAATRAAEHLYLARPATDEKGRPILQSFYVEELLDLFAPDSWRALVYGPSRPTPTLNEAASPSEAAVATALDIREERDSTKALEKANMAAGFHSAFAHALRSAGVEARRESLADFDLFDGVLTGTGQGTITDKFPAGTPWSYTLLNAYRECPFRFFLDRVLEVDRPDDPLPALTPLDTGTVAHDVLAAFFSSLKARGYLNVLGANGQVDVTALLSEVLEREARTFARRRAIDGDPFWTIEKTRLWSLISGFVSRELARLSNPVGKDKAFCVPAFFELGFGLKRSSAAGKDRDSRSSEEPVVIEVGARQERLAGKIDRVDRVFADPDAVAAGEGSALAVVDYKLSQAPSGKSVKALSDLQMAVYLAAVRRLLLSGGFKPLRAVYAVLRGDKRASTVLSLDDEGACLEYERALADALFSIADGIRAGRFPATPSSKCRDHCPGRGVCRYSELRHELHDDEYEER
jgi:ATP-dependent helicase/DNAse subunit B